ncbi:alpha/beta fold hydrolase [Actinosynnema sp. ALI-1.44]|uniref:alpha/beta fold hydrolase n=1 Tax=Actinosynnema sp. ALI-1.44 TaxID=1933779 RepID=UPI001178B8DE|nr:alpha/beta fold hydrolase [Actinosynnema sp. ALI-1.44]
MARLSVLSVMLAAALAPVAAAETDREPVRWHDCPSIPGIPMEKLRCATVTVPMNYADPGGRHISIEISRRQADNPAQRRGVMLLNPGGPGGPALPMPLQFEQLPGAEAVLGSYDLVAFDPRGVGLSTPVTCRLRPDQRNGSVSPYPRDEADIDRYAQRAREVAQQCGKDSDRDLLPHITTANTARDMDRIRVALGVPRISYYGASYGSYLGAVYASLFPQRTDRVVLDAVLGPQGLDVDGVRRFGQGVQDRFPDFAAWAAKRHSTYQLGATPQAVTVKFYALAARLDREPIGKVDGAAFRASLFNALYNDRSFPGLAESWRLLDNGKEPPRDNEPPGGGYPDMENRAAAQLHVLCNDSDWPEDIGHYRRAVRLERLLRPMFGPAAANAHPCAFWPVDPVEPPVAITSRGPSNILLVQNLRDPATPLRGAQLMRAALGQRAGLLTVDAGGHGVLNQAEGTCARDIVLRFMTGDQPPRDGHCPSPGGGVHEKVKAEVDALVDSGEATAALVRTRDSNGQWAAAAGVRDLTTRLPADARGKFRIASTTKAFTATVVLQLVDENRIALDAPVERYLPGLVPDGARITVRQVLNHTSGLHDFASEPGYEAWNYPALQRSHTPAELLAVAFAHPPTNPPGAKWDYSNTNYVLAGQLIERLTGRPWAAEVQRRLLRPLGMRDTTLPGTSKTIPRPHAHGYMRVPPTEGARPELIDVTSINPSVVGSAGEIISTTEDLTRFFDALLGGRLLSRDTLTQMRTTVATHPGAPRWRDGLGVFSSELSCGLKVWGHDGGALGFQTFTARSDDGRQLVLSVNPYDDLVPDAPIKRIQEAYFCR